MKQGTTTLILKIQERFLRWTKKFNDITLYGDFTQKFMSKIKRYIDDDTYVALDNIRLGICAKRYLAKI